MNHQPFEDWLLEEDLSEDQRQALNDHLLACDDCRKLASALQITETQFRSAPQVDPAPGFAQRWMAREVQAREKRARRLTWTGFLVCFAGIIALSLVLVLPDISSWPSPVGFLAMLLYNSTVLAANLTDVGEFLLALVRSLPIGIPVFIWIVLAMNLCIWSLIWAVSIWRLPRLSRSQHEARN